jgi:hypothetical protein
MYLYPPVSTVLLLPLQSYSRQVGPSFFSDRIPTMPLEQSEALVAALRQIGQLDEAGYLQFNPDRSPVSTACSHQAMQLQWHAAAPPAAAVAAPALSRCVPASAPAIIDPSHL